MLAYCLWTKSCPSLSPLSCVVDCYSNELSSVLTLTQREIVAPAIKEWNISLHSLESLLVYNLLQAIEGDRSHVQTLELHC
jgi:hypothetical protein